MRPNKVILFIVEGITDRDSLALILSELIPNNTIKFYIVNGDITTKKTTNPQNCIKKVNDCINKFLKDNKFIKSDILTIIHLIDTDGAYVNENYIQEISNAKLEYTPNCIITKNKSLIYKRNLKKSLILNKLYTNKYINNISYYMYYFSCNLEHVLHNEQNLNDNLKSSYADKFTDNFIGREKDFIKFLNKPDICVSGDYNKTWDFIKKDNNSLNRHCNFHLFLNNYCK